MKLISMSCLYYIQHVFNLQTYTITLMLEYFICVIIFHAVCVSFIPCDIFLHSDFTQSIYFEFIFVIFVYIIYAFFLHFLLIL